MNVLFLFILGTFVTLSAQAQEIVKSLERRVPGQGTVTIHQDSRITELLGGSSGALYSSGGQDAPAGTSVDSGERKFLKAVGYRVQVYAGNNSRNAREEALGMSSKVKEYFPELPVYTHFLSPRWLCRVGDFRSIEEADAQMRKLKATGVFKEVSIVKEQINIPL